MHTRLHIKALAQKHSQDLLQQKVEKVFETYRADLASSAGGAINNPRLRAELGFIGVYLEIYRLKALLDGHAFTQPTLNGLRAIPPEDQERIKQALNQAVDDSVRKALEEYGATEALARALSQIERTYEELWKMF